MNMIEKRKAMAGQGGFTLIELLVVIAILAILAGAAIIGIGAMRGNAQASTCKNEKATIETALEAHAINTNAVADIAGAQAAGLLKKVDPNDWTVNVPAGITDAYEVEPAANGKYDAVIAECMAP